MSELGPSESELVRSTSEQSPRQRHPESSPEQRKPAVRVTNEQLAAVTERPITLPHASEEEASEEQLTYGEISRKLIDLSTGKAAASVNLLPEQNRFLHEATEKAPEQIKKAFETYRGVLILSPTAWSMLDAVVTQSQRTNKELGLTIQGISQQDEDTGKTLMISSHIVPAHDYATAQERVADMTDVDRYQENAEDYVKNTHLAPFYAAEAVRRKSGALRNGEPLFTLHTHQEQLGDHLIATPSPEDEKDVARILEKKPDYRWGVATKTANGTLHLAMFISSKDAAGHIHHHRVAILSPDLTETLTAPDGAYGETDDSTHAEPTPISAEESELPLAA